MVMPIGIGKDDNSMFQAAPFDINKFTEDCEKQYGVSPRPHWITTYYGGHVSIFATVFIHFIIVILN